MSPSAPPTQASRLTYHSSLSQQQTTTPTVASKRRIQNSNDRQQRQTGRMSKRSRSLSSSPSSPASSPVPPGASTSPLPQGPSKVLQLQDTADPAVEIMRCSLPPHRETLSFQSYTDYEVHYRQAHVNRCVECGKNFPTERFLDLHIEENHDPLTAARRERGEKTVCSLFPRDN